MTASPLPRPLRVAGGVFAAVLGALLVLTVFALGWVAIRGAIAADSLRSAQGSATEVVSNISDPAAAASAIEGVADRARTARELTSDPVWWIVEQTPWLGPQLAAVSTIAEAVDDVASDALTPLADVVSTLSPAAFLPTAGRVELSGFVAMRPAATAAADSMASAAGSVERINTAALVAPLRDVVIEVADTFGQTKRATSALANASVLLPAMLGADGPRNYLVLFQNNAEWRSLGGIAGAMAVIHTDGGGMTLGAQESSTDFAGSVGYDGSVLPLDAEIAAIYGQRPGKWIQNVTQLPDFAVSATLAREMWAREHGGEQVDGVFALDPVSLSYLLKATGPVTLPTGDVLTAENAVQLLLNDVYLRYERPADQDVFFASAAASVFTALSQGGVDPGALITALGRAGDERRLLMWSAHPDEQEILAGTSLAGGLPVTDASASRFGVYLNDGGGSKMDYYMSAESSIAWDECTVTGSDVASGTATLGLTLTSNAPPDAANLPEYITAAGWFGVPPGVARTIGYIYLPEGFELLDATMTGELGFGGGMHDGRRVLSFAVDLAPGASATAYVTVRAPEGSASKLLVESTPTLATPVEVAAVCDGP